MKGISAVPHTNTVFRDILKLLPWSAFRSACRGARDRRIGSQFHHQAAVDGAVVWSIVGGAFAARHRSVDGEPSGAALSCGRRRSGALDLRRRQSRPRLQGFLGSFHRHAGHGDARPAPQDGRRGAADRLDQPASGGRGRRMGALFGRGLRRQGACRLRPRSGAADLPHDHRGHGQRHRRGQNDADRRRRDLCLRPGLLRLRLVGARSTRRAAAS